MSSVFQKALANIIRANNQISPAAIVGS
jgi:hypothetical protein